MTIKDKILDILRKNGEIDNYSCIDSRLTTRLGAFIHTLKVEGKIEVDEDKSDYIKGTKNYRYVIKPLVPRNVERFIVRGGNEDGTDKLITRTTW